MKIVVVGGKARSLARHRGPLLRAMKEAGHDVVACAPGHELRGVEQLHEMGVRFVPVPLQRTSRNPIEDLRALSSLTSLMRRERPDVCFTYTIKPVIYGSAAARLAGVGRRFALITGLGQAFADSSLRGRALKSLVSRLYRSSLGWNQRVFFQNADDASEFIANRILPNMDRVSIVNGSGIDLDEFAQVPLPEGPPRFLWMGRLLADKGLIEVVEAVPLVRRRFPDIRVQVLGLLDPAHPAALSRGQVEAWAAAGMIEFLGGAEDVRPHLARASVLLYPSYREGTPRSVLEAMAMGRPVITTDVPGCRDTIEDRVQGFVVPARDPAAIAEAICKFCEDPGLVSRMGARARSRAAEKYDVRKVNETMLKQMGLL